MHQAVPQRYRSVVRIFSACLLTWLLIMLPLVPFAPVSRGESRAANRESARTQTPASTAAATTNTFVNAPVPQPAPAPMYAPVITATKDDGIAAATPVAPGGTITYTVNVNNTGVTSPADDALSVVFSDTIDAHTTLVPGSPIAAASDKYSTIGNVQLTIPDGATDLLGNDFDPDTGNNTGMTATAETKSSTACTGGCSGNVTINANGSFTYDPPVGFTGTDTFTYTSNSGTSSISTTVTITVANKLWFISNNAGACTSNCDGRLSHPFTSLANFNTANLGGPGQPGDNDWIFIYESGTAYTGPVNLRAGQKLIGQDATATLIGLTGFSQPSGTDPLPVTNAANGVFVTITTTAPATNGINLNSGNTLRGFTVGNTTGAKISGNAFGTLLVGNSTSPDVTLNGTGQALSLTNGILSVGGKFASVTTTSSTAQGINLTGVSDSGAGAFSFGSTSVSNSTTQGILVGTSTADLDFGNTSVSGGSDAISLQNNSAGTKTFGTITTSGNSGVGFLHGAGGGAVTVTGATSITNPGGNGIDIDTSNANVAFAATTVSKNAAGTAVDLTNNTGRTISFTSLAITNSVGIGLNANASGTVTVGAGSISTTGAGPAATLTNTILGLVFTSVSSNNGTNGITFSGGSGTFQSGTTNLQNSLGIGLSMASSAVAASFGNTTVNSSAGAAVNLSSNSGNISFADFDLTPDSSFRGLDAQNNTGTITTTSGDVAATGNAAIFIDGPAGRTPLAMVLNNVDSTTSSGDGVNLTDVSGSFVVNDATLATNISGSAGIGISVNNSTMTTANFGITTVGTTTGTGISVASSPSGAVSFGTTSIQNTTGTGISVTSTGASVTFGGTTVNGTGNANADDIGTGIILTNNSGAMTFGALTVTPDSGERGLFVTDNDGATSAGLITIPSGTITTTNDTAVEIRGATTTARNPLNIQLTTVNTTGGATAGNGIFLQNTNSGGSPGGFRVLGTGGTCTSATPTCTGGRITNTTGADGATGGTAVRLDTADDVVLTRMRLDTNTNFAVRGFSVTGFVMDTCVVNGTNGNSAAASEGSVIFDNLFGTAAGSNSNLITASDIRGGWGDNIRVTNNTNTAGELTIQNSTIRDTNTGTNGNDNIQIVTHNSGNLKAVVTGSTFAATNGDHIQTAADGQSQLTIIFTGNTLSGGGGINALGQGITISGGDIVGGVTDSTEVMRFDISNNTMSGTIQGGAININEGSGNGNWQGRVSGNTIGVAANAGSGASQSSGIRVENHSKGTLTASVLNNQVHQWSNQGINLQAGDSTASGLGNGPLNVTVTGNTVDSPNNNPPTAVPDHGIQLNIATTTGNTNQACVDLLNNNSTGNLAGGGVDYRVRERFLATVRLPGYTGANSDNAAVRTYVLGRPNTAGHGNPNDVGVSNNVAAGGGGYINTNPAGSQCAQPTVPTAPAVVTQNFQNQKGDVFAANTSKAGSDVASTPATQSASVNAPSFWQRTVTAVASFAGAFSSMIAPTAHAAEITAPSEAEKAVSENVQQPAKVLSHHAAPARRAVKTQNAAMNHAAPAMAAPMSGETVTANIGTLPAGGTVTIKFQVTVNNAPNLTLLGPPRVENQGKVSGSNFGDVFTDDPEVAGTQKTVTLVDLFNTSTNLVSNLNPSNFGDQVTFTATVSETPAQGTADPTGTVDFIDVDHGNTVICDNVPLSGGQAQCQTSSLAAVTHQIRADYSGDGNFDPSQSNVVNQQVIPCSANPIVTTTADSGAGSLRDALSQVCSGTTITFDITGAGPHTITALTPLVVDKNTTIKNNSGESITVSGGNLVRVFNVNSGKTASIIGLTISGGKGSTSGGGILNDGTLTIVNSTLSGNNTDIDGGGISNSATGTLTLINTTISGNNAAGNGGGVANLGGTVTSINSTITNNRADNDANSIGTGGGINNVSGTTTLHNTIVAGNFNEDGVTDAADDISGTVNASSSFNLIGTGGAGGLTDGGNNNQVGVADAGLGTLGDNGGTTQTHALLQASTAIERGSNANLPQDTFDLDGDTITAEPLPFDQRGTGFPRNADSFDPDTIQTVDIGAFELHPSIEDIPNQSTNEDTQKDVTFNLGDDTGSLIATVTATSSNTTLVPNANMNFTGSGGSRTLHITPASNENGSTTITVTVTATNGRTATDTFDLTVDAANDAPVANNDAYATDEDTPLVVNAALGVLANDTDVDTPAGSLTAVLVVGPANASSFMLNADGSFSYTPNSNFFGGDSFTYKANDGTSDSNIATVTLTVNPINDPPSFTIAANPPASAQDAGPQSVSNFATNISQGPGESGQTLTFNVSATGSTGTLTFSTAPAINSTTGALTYTATNGTSGTASFSVTLSDNGSNSPPNSNTSGAQSFTITVFPPNASPVVTTTAGNLAYTENAGAVAIDPGLTVTDSDNTDLTGASVSITAGFASAQDTLGFATQNGITGIYNSGTGVLTLSGTSSVTNYQTALRSVTYTNSSDDPTASRTITFTASDGISLAGSATRGIAISAVNDGPLNTVPAPQTTNEDTAKVFSISVADVDAGSNPVKITLTATNGTVTLSGTGGLGFTTGDGTDDATMVFTGTLTAVNAAMTNLSFNPTADFNGLATLQIISDDQGNTGSGGAKTDTDTVNITVNAANDAPVVTTTVAALSYTENDAATAIDPGLTVTDVDSLNLVGATVAITSGHVAAQDTLTFTNQNGITGSYNSGTGVLTLTGPSSVANFQTALRTVKYQNSSDDPTASRTITFTVDDGTATDSDTRIINITAVNDAPVNNVPGPQGTNQNTPLTFSSGNGNQISITDADAGTNDIQVTLTATNGTLTLSGTTGLAFTVNDGTADATMTFTGTITNINAALNGMTFTPTAGFNGAATLTIVSNDQGNSGTGGAKSDTDVLNIQVATNISIQDAQVAEPASGSVNMIFTVTLSAPAPAGGASVSFATQDLPGSCITCAVAGQDYTAQSGTLSFATGEQFKTIAVPVLADNKKNEAPEQFQVVLSSPTNATIADGTAIGTILITNQPGALLISEIRTSGPAGSGDDFVEIYNNSDSPHIVPAGPGYGLFKMGATCGDAPVLVGIIPGGTTIPGRGHFLFTGPTYSLANYGGTGNAAGDVSVADIENDRNVALFTTTSVGSISTANRLDAVGFGPNVGGVCDLFREGNTLTPTVGSVLEYTYFRDECGKKGVPSNFGPCPTGGMTKDSNSNFDDFIFADTSVALTPAGQHLGAPGPQNLGSPRFNLSVLALLLDSTKGAAGSPNRERDTTPVTNGSQGTLSIRRRFQNNTGAPVTRLRIRVVDISTAPVTGSTADLRAIDSGNITVSVNDPATCTAAGFATKPCNVTVLGTTVETPPNQPLGGGNNSSMTIILGTPLAPNASVSVQFLLGVQATGSFKFFFNVEALP